MVAAAKVTPILAAVSTKNGSGTMFINKSVDGSRIHRSLVKNILWKSIKYFVKSVDIMAARAAVNAKNSAVPIQSIRGSRRFISAFVRQSLSLIHI